MKRLILFRDVSEPERTTGELWYDGNHFLFTMEPGDDDADYPRVDPGFYHCVHHDSTRFGKTWALVGADVSHFDENRISRSTCLFHRGNKDEHTRGCILLGKKRGMLEGEPAVLQSRPAMSRLRNLIGADEFYLTII